MAKTWNVAETQLNPDSVVGATTKATHTFTFSTANYTTTLGSTTAPAIGCTVLAKYNTNANGRTAISDSLSVIGTINGVRVYSNRLVTENQTDFFSTTPSSLAANTNKTMIIGSGFPGAISISTDPANLSDIFTSNNATQRTLNISWTLSNAYVSTYKYISSFPSGYYNNPGWYWIASGEGTSTTFNEGTLTLNAPPIIDSTHNTASLSYSPTGVGIYTLASTISVAVNNLSAQYGGSITKVTLQIGNQSVEKISDFTSPITLVPETVPTSNGKVTPRVIFTDSRGQTSFRDLEEITILPYECTILNSQAIRTNAQFIRDDEETNGVISATFKHSHFSNSYLTKPIVNYSESGAATTTTITDEITWYQDWSATTGTFSNEITTSSWQTLPAEILLYGKINNITFNKNKSYTINIIPTTSIKPGGGSAKATILSQSFYLLAGRPGGHGLGIGVKPTTDALYVGMEAFFGENVYIKTHKVPIVYMATTTPTSSDGEDGDVWLVYS